METLCGDTQSSQTHSTYVVLPNTYEDLCDWCCPDSRNAILEDPRTEVLDRAQFAARYGDEIVNQVVYHTETHLPDGRLCVLVDIGSIGNLCGSAFADALAEVAQSHGLSVRTEKRDRTLTVSGVGSGKQTAYHNIVAPVCIPTEPDPSVKEFETEGKHVLGQYSAPVIPNTHIPGLLGKNALKKLRTIIDVNNDMMYWLGPGEYDILKHLPPGSKALKLHQAKSGHYLLPISDYSHAKEDAKPDPSGEVSLNVDEVAKPQE